MNPLLTALTLRCPTEIVIASPAESWTAADALAAITELRVVLADAGVNRLGLLAANAPTWLVADLACLAADICLLPLPVFFSTAQLSHSIDAVGVDAVLTDDPQRVAACAAVQPATASICWHGLTLVKLQSQTQATLPQGTRKITFTSGSTGAPRGVCLGSAQQIAVARALHATLQISAPKHLCLLPLSTLLENIGGGYYPLLAGGSVLTPKESDTGFSGSTGLNMPVMLQAISRHQPTSILLLPQMLVGLVTALDEGWLPPSQLQYVAVGGARVSADLIRRARAHGLPVYEGYGLSETGSVACLNFPGSDQPGSVGKPLAHLKLSIAAGEVQLSGNSFLGYVGDPASWGAATIATGDLGAVDADGFLHLHGRRKNLLISSFGRNISPEWPESEVLLHREIRQCIVYGDARPYCMALIAAANAAVTDARIEQLLAAVNAKLPDYARIQRWHRLAAPLTHAGGLYTENGRPRRAAIANHYAAVIEQLYQEDAATVCAAAKRISKQPLAAVGVKTV